MLQYTIGGRVVDEDALKNIASATPKPIKATRDAPQEFHKGFYVEGYKATQIEAERELAEKRLADWRAKPEPQRQSEMKHGAREPKPWSEEAWIAANKPKRLSRLYGTPEAAQEFAELARKSGYVHVRATENSKRKP